MEKTKKQQPLGLLDEALIEVLVKYEIPLMHVRERLDSLAEQITFDSAPYLYHTGWDGERKPGIFERIYGVKPFGPCSFDATGWHCYDKEGKEIPHKKVVIGHLGDQELFIDVLDRKDQ